MSRATAFIIAVAVLLADQLSKEVVRARVHDFDIIVVIPGCLNIIRSAQRLDLVSHIVQRGLETPAGIAHIFIVARAKNEREYRPCFCSFNHSLPRG